MKILLVDDTKTERLIMMAFLNNLGYEVILGENGKQAVELYHSEHPDLVIMDVIMPEMDGYEAARTIRADDSGWIPIIFLSARIGPDDIAEGINAGGDDYLTKPVNHIVLEAKMKAMQRIAEMRHQLLDVSKELKKANAELKQLVNVDGLTGLSNRRHMDEALRIEMARCMRNQQHLTIVLADVDHFKAYNDNYGHLEGDDCLKKIATVMRAVCKRTTDVVARYGGEEFALILTDTSTQDAQIMGESVRKAVEDLKIPHAKSPVSDFCTVSVGVFTCIPRQQDKNDAMLEQTDNLLYKAKQAGRNRVEIGGCDMHSVLQVES